MRKVFSIIAISLFILMVILSLFSCGSEEAIEEPKEEHIHNMVVREEVPSTCTTKGYRIESCSCGVSRTIEKEIQHDLSDSFIDKDFLRSGRVCRVCGFLELTTHYSLMEESDYNQYISDTIFADSGNVWYEITFEFLNSKNPNVIILKNQYTSFETFQWYVDGKPLKTEAVKIEKAGMPTIVTICDSLPAGAKLSVRLCFNDKTAATIDNTSIYFGTK